MSFIEVGNYVRKNKQKGIAVACEIQPFADKSMLVIGEKVTTTSIFDDEVRDEIDVTQIVDWQVTHGLFFPCN